MLRAAFLALLAGCTFRDGVAPQQSDGGPHDVGPPPDGPLPVCIAMGTGSPSVVGHLGGNGSTTSDQACPSDELPIGMRFTMAADPGHTEPVAVATQIICGHVRRETNGTWTSTPGQMLSFTQQGTCLPPPPQGPVHMCPLGMVLVGVTGNTPGNSDYNSVKLFCRQPDQAMVVQVSAGDTGTFTDTSQSAQCVANQVVVSFSARASCTQESLVVRCAPEVCLPPQ